MLLLLFILLAAAPALVAQQQPLAFPHNTHVEAGLQCVDCHTGADIYDRAGLPSTQKCMLCHEKIAAGKPAIQQLAEYWEKKREVPWVRVYGFHPEAAVKFRHAPHARAGVECAECHGNVAGMTVATEAVEHTMGRCVSCHRANQASDDCVACHY